MKWRAFRGWRTRGRRVVGEASARWWVRATTMSALRVMYRGSEGVDPRRHARPITRRAPRSEGRGPPTFSFRENHFDASEGERTPSCRQRAPPAPSKPSPSAMGKSSGWIYEGHAPLMAKRQGRRGEKRRRLVGGAVILALTIAVFAFARSSSGPDDEESLGWGDSPSDDGFDVPTRRFGGGSHAHAAVRPHRFNGDDAHGADAMHATHSAMDSMNSLSLGSTIDNHPVTSQRDRHREANRFHGATSGSSHHHGAIHDARPMTRDDDGAHALQAPPRIDFDHRPLVSHGGGWDAQPLIESRVRHRDCGVTPATLAAATAHDSPDAVRDLTSTDAARWFRRFWEPCVSCADEEQIGGERIDGANDGDSASIESETDSETMGGRWVCDPERMIATPESDAEFKSRVEAERKAQKHTWLESLSLFGGSKGGAQREEPSHGSLPGEKVGCVVLTVGVNIGDSRGGFAFEKDMRRLYGCEVHVFDAAAGASGPSEDLGEDLSEDDGGMAFTAGVSLAATSTAPSLIAHTTRHTINGGGLDAESSFDGTTDEDDDEEFRGETNDDDEDDSRRSSNGRNLKVDSSFLSGGASYSKTEREGTQGTYAMSLSEMIDQATRGSMKGGSEGGHALVDVVRIACDGCEIEALTTPDSLHALKERVKQLLLEVRYTPGDVPVEAAPASVRGGGFHSGSFRERQDDDEDTEDEGLAEGSVTTQDYSGGNDPSNVATGTAGLWRKLQVDAGMLPFHKEVEIVDLSQEHHVGGADPLRRGVTTKKSVGFFGALFGAASRGGRRSSGDLGPVVEYGLINERMVRKTKGRAGTRDY